VIDVLSDLFILRGIPAHIRSDNGPEFVAKAVQDWIAVVGAMIEVTASSNDLQGGVSQCGIGMATPHPRGQKSGLRAGPNILPAFCASFIAHT